MSNERVRIYKPFRYIVIALLLAAFFGGLYLNALNHRYKPYCTMSSKEDIAFRKLSMLMKAVTGANEQDDTLEELKAAAFEVLRLNPGCEQSDWAKILIEQYGTEVVDAYGKDPAEAYASLEELWESPYLDEVSGLEYDFKTWAEAFATDAAVQMYYDLTEKNE